jgi:hypothetical protein
MKTFQVTRKYTWTEVHVTTVAATTKAEAVAQLKQDIGSREWTEAQELEVSHYTDTVRLVK